MPPRKRAASTTKPSSAAHTISLEDGSSQLKFSSSSSFSSSRKTIWQEWGPYVFKFGLLLLTLMSISASLYTIAEPIMESQRAVVANDPGKLGSLGLLLVRTAVVKVGWDLGLDGARVAAYLAYLRQPFWILLYLFYQVSLPTIAIDIGVDVASAFLAFSLIGAVSKPYPKDVRHAAIFKNRGNKALLSILAINVLALSLYASSASGYLSSFIVRTFYPVPSVEAIHGISLSTSALLVSLSGLIVPFILASPPKPQSTNTFTSRVFHTHSIAGRIGLLTALTYIETVTHVFVAIKGSTSEGAIGYAAGWAGATALTGAVLAWVNRATVLDVEDKELLESIRRIEYENIE